MKRLLFNLCALGLWLFFTPTVFASNLKIVDLTGAEKSVNAGSLRTLTFSGNNLNINYQDGTSEAVDVLQIRKIYFGELTSAAVPVPSGKVVVYPNPVADFLNLRNLPDGIRNVSILDISGRCVLNQSLSSGESSLSVSHLPAGLYLLRINNQTIRISKQ